MLVLSFWAESYWICDDSIKFSILFSWCVTGTSSLSTGDPIPRRGGNGKLRRRSFSFILYSQGGTKAFLRNTYIKFNVFKASVHFKTTFRIHLILTWIRIWMLGSTFGKRGSGSGIHLSVIVDPDPRIRIWNKWIRIRVQSGSGSGSEYLFFIFFIKKFMSDKLQCLFCYRQNLEKAFLR